MRATSVLRFVVLGAVGVGIGWAMAGLLAVMVPMWSPYTSYFLAGACGGVGLGLALRDWKRVAALALMVWWDSDWGGSPHVYLGVHRLASGLDEHRNGHGPVRGCDVGIGFWGLEGGCRSFVGGIGAFDKAGHLPQAYGCLLSSCPSPSTSTSCSMPPCCWCNTRWSKS